MELGLIASSGGHWEELVCLKQLTQKYTAFYVTEEGGQAQDSKAEPLYLVPQINRREKGFLLHFIKLLGKAWKIMGRERPDAVVTTGALIAFPVVI